MDADLREYLGKIYGECAESTGLSRRAVVGVEELGRRMARVERTIYGSLPPPPDDGAPAEPVPVPRASRPEPAELETPPAFAASPAASGAAILGRLQALEATAIRVERLNVQQVRAMGLGRGVLVGALRAPAARDVIKILTLIAAIVAGAGACVGALRGAAVPVPLSPPAAAR